MNKVVYNAEYGGFGLSNKVAEWLEKNAKDQELITFLKDIKLQLIKNIEGDDSFYGVDHEDIYEQMVWGLLFDFKETGIPRHHPDLVKCVEELGEDAGNIYAKLKIAYIKGNKYRIDEYDGYETVIEPEDEKWITIE